MGGAPLNGTILITGNGTLTRAILRQAARDRWDAAFTVFSRSESRLALLKRRYPKVRTIVGDVRDPHAVTAAVAGHETVIHGAAMKRIPECEQQPDECIATNVIGTAHVARACLAHGVQTAALISTDKACKAVTVYGASKLMAEGLWRAMPDAGTRFVGVRYGNVVASNGSVIPVWREQARQGKPLTITDARMTRFWMSPTEAVTLIQDAHERGTHGAVLIPKMSAMPIPAMADTICPGHRTTEVGLRSTEKLHEDLVHTCEVAAEGINTFRLTANGDLGHHYDSATCPTLTAAQFRAMLSDAEDLEAEW